VASVQPRKTVLWSKEAGLGKVIASASMSLDGYIAKDDNTIGRLFDWLQNGDVEFLTRTGSGDMTFHLGQSSARYWRDWTSGSRCPGMRADVVRRHRRDGAGGTTSTCRSSW
jgi:hypothetical protein